MLPLALLGCKKENRSITYPLHPHAGYPTTGTATFTENKNETDIVINLSNLSPGTNYMAHIHEQDTSKYGGSTIVLNFGSFNPATATYTLEKTWDKSFDDVLTYDGCIAVHNPNVGVALGNIGSNAQ